MLKVLIELFEKSELYTNFMGKMPYPFNDLYFGIAIILIIICLITVYIYRSVKTFVIKKKIKVRQEKARLKRLEEEERERTERNELIKIMRDTTKKSEKDDKEYKATHDVSTGLFNKLSYSKALSKMDLENLTCIYADINNLSKTNDEYGKSYGDKLLKAVANELNEAFPDKCYRVGGDEFIVLALGMSEKIAAKRLEKIKENLDAMTDLDTDGIIYSVAFGIAVSDGTLTKQEIIDLAESRMKEDKEYKKAETIKKHGDDGYIDKRTQVSVMPIEDLEDTDMLTGCKTKESFEEMIAKVDETNLSVISADIDGLKIINDNVNHHAGDMVIKGFAKILRKHFGSHVYRISDDDFCVVTNEETKDSLYKKLNLVKIDMLNLTKEAEKGVFYSASFGVSTNADDGDMLIDAMLDECLIKMRSDKEDFRSGARSGVIVSEKAKNEEIEYVKNTVYDIEGIIEDKRKEFVATEEEETDDGLTRILLNMKTRQEEGEMEAENDEKRRMEKEKKEAKLNEEIKKRFNEEDLTSHKHDDKKKRADEEKALRSEMLRAVSEDKKKKNGFFKKDDTDAASSGDVTGNTVKDVDIL